MLIIEQVDIATRLLATKEKRVVYLGNIVCDRRGPTTYAELEELEREVTKRALRLTIIPVQIKLGLFEHRYFLSIDDVSGTKELVEEFKLSSRALDSSFRRSVTLEVPLARSVCNMLTSLCNNASDVNYLTKTGQLLLDTLPEDFTQEDKVQLSFFPYLMPIWVSVLRLLRSYEAMPDSLRHDVAARIARSVPASEPKPQEVQAVTSAFYESLVFAALHERGLTPSFIEESEYEGRTPDISVKNQAVVIECKDCYSGSASTEKWGSLVESIACKVDDALGQLFSYRSSEKLLRICFIDLPEGTLRLLKQEGTGSLDRLYENVFAELSDDMEESDGRLREEKWRFAFTSFENDSFGNLNWTLPQQPVRFCTPNLSTVQMPPEASGFWSMFRSELC